MQVITLDMVREENIHRLKKLKDNFELTKPEIDYHKAKELRCELGFTQKDLADYLGIDNSVYAKKENGKVSFSFIEIYKLTELYGCSFQRFIKERVVGD